MALEPITRKEKIIAGQYLTPITRMEMFLKQYGGGGSVGGVQPDWNQNDSTAADYIKNRPFYTAYVETVLVEESTVSFNANDAGVYTANLGNRFLPTFGETYKVSWDGTTYECACIDYMGATVIGNLSIMGAGPDTGEPFVIAVNKSGLISIFTADTSASHTISISGDVESAVKIDRKYLPKAAVITYDSSSGTYSSDLTVEELYEILSDGKQVVYRDTNKNGYSYLISWALAAGRTDLIFGGDVHVSLFSDGTIGAMPNS